MPTVSFAKSLRPRLVEEYFCSRYISQGLTPATEGISTGPGAGAHPSRGPMFRLHAELFPAGLFLILDGNFSILFTLHHGLAVQDR